MEVLGKLEGDDERELSGKEKKLMRGKIGELLWVSLLTRPDLSFDVNILSSEIASGTVKTAKDINKVLLKAKLNRNTMKFRKLGDLSKLTVQVYGSI